MAKKLVLDRTRLLVGLTDITDASTVVPVVVDATGKIGVSGVAGGGGGGTEFAEDAVAANGAFGTLALAVRKDTDGSDVSASGDYAWLQTDANGYLKVSSKVNRVTKTDRSGTITSGGVAQQLMPSNATRNGWQIWNLSNADLWVNESGATAVQNQPSFRLPAGGYYEGCSTGVTTAAISIIGATTGQAFASREW